ncbi:MAG TPA: solute carrier family 23 protein [Solirubrobacteraceae bacterium]|nr:solute carrier family 23 protein [Solirubrobacteraceae bacterium]
MPDLRSLVTTQTLPRRPVSWRRDTVAALLWMVAVVPAAMGFWLVAGSLAGVAQAQLSTLVAASLLGLGIATLLQVAFGFRLPMYEGPAAAYLAAITVVTAEGQHSLGAITGGLIAAGAFVALLGAVGADRLIAKAFTPLVANVFVLTVTSALMPATVERAVGATNGLPGKGPAWAATIVVVAVALAVRRVPRLIPYSLLAALVAGTAVYVALAGAPQVLAGGSFAAPSLLPWGTPNASAAVVIPFLLAGALAAFNTVASGKVVSTAHELPVEPGAQQRSFLMHGAAQAGGALFGNLVGTVSRIDSIGIAQLLGHRGRAPLLLCGVLVAALGFVTPFVHLVAALPLSVSAALLAVLLSLILLHAARGIAREPRAVVARVVVPAMIPTAVWIAVGSSLPPAVQLVANPMLWGVLIAMVLERIAHRMPRQ